MKAVLLVLALLAMPAHAHDWTPSEKGWAAAWLATRAVARNPDRFRERNPLLPEHPTLGDVNRHFLVSTAVMLAAAHYLPQYRTAMLQVWVAVGVIGTARNAHIGVRFDF